MKNFNRYLEIIQEMKISGEDEKPITSTKEIADEYQYRFAGSNIKNEIMMILPHTGKFSDINTGNINSKSYSRINIKKYINEYPNNYNFAIFIQDHQSNDAKIKEFEEKVKDIANEICKPPCNPIFTKKGDFISAQFSSMMSEKEEITPEEEAEGYMKRAAGEKRNIRGFKNP